MIELFAAFVGFSVITMAVISFGLCINKSCEDLVKEAKGQ